MKQTISAYIVLSITVILFFGLAMPTARARENLPISIDLPDKVTVGREMSGSVSITVPDIAGTYEADLSVSVYAVLPQVGI